MFLRRDCFPRRKIMRRNAPKRNARVLRRFYARLSILCHTFLKISTSKIPAARRGRKARLLCRPGGGSRALSQRPHRLRPRGRSSMGRRGAAAKRGSTRQRDRKLTRVESAPRKPARNGSRRGAKRGAHRQAARRRRGRAAARILRAGAGKRGSALRFGGRAVPHNRHLLSRLLRCFTKAAGSLISMPAISRA